MKMIEELIKEEISALKDLNSLKNSPPSLDKINFSDFQTISEASFQKIFEDLIEKSGAALKECQLIESLDEQLRRLNETQTFLQKLKQLNQLNELIMNWKDSKTSEGLNGLVERVLEWRQYSADSVVMKASENGEAVKFFIDNRIPEMIDEEIGVVLGGWTDEADKIDREAVALLSGRLQLDPSTNPLHGLFSTYPLSLLNPLLQLHTKLDNTKRILKAFPERLLNRFYDILQGHGGGQRKAAVVPFSVGLIEEMVPEKMKYASRISCILEATAFFSILHGDLTAGLFDKCGQIAKQIRKCAREERKWTDSSTPALLDAQLNEICLIACTLSDFLRLHPESSVQNLSSERDKWALVYRETESIYLQKGIKRAIEMDQIVNGGGSEANEFPVSSCVDDIFYVLQAAKKRSERILIDPLAFIARAFNDLFLLVLKKHLATALSLLSPLQNLFHTFANNQPFKPSRELISALVLVNNLVATRAYWTAFTASLDGSDVSEELEKTFEWAVQEGLYAKSLQDPVRKELEACRTVENLFSKLQSILLTINSLFKAILARNALNEILSSTIGEFSQLLCKQLLSEPSTTTTTANFNDSAVYLRYDRLLHELIQSCEDFGLVAGFESKLSRLQQIISILLCEKRHEAQELVEEWKRDGICSLRAGEILLLLNKKPQ